MAKNIEEERWRRLKPIIEGDRQLLAEHLSIFLNAVLIPFEHGVSRDTATPEMLEESMERLQQLREALSTADASHQHQNGRIQHTDVTETIATTYVSLPAGVTRALRDELDIHYLSDFASTSWEQICDVSILNRGLQERLLTALRKHEVELPTGSPKSE